MLVYNGILISWFALFVSVGCAVGMIISVILRKMQNKSISDIFIVTSLSVPLGLIFGRLLYSLFSNGVLKTVSQYLNIANGGFGLYGVFFGVYLAIVIACRFFGCGERRELLDCVSVGGALAITIGRFATCFTSSEIGYPVDFRVFAVYDVKEKVYNLAIYDLDGIFEALIFIICLFSFIYTRNRKGTAGITFLIMLSLHGTNQVVMDSMRADPLMLGINNFIKISQIIGILCCVSVLVYLMVVTAKADRFSRFHLISIPVILVSIVLGVLGEYRVGSTDYISKHLLMLFGMLMLDWLTLVFAFRMINLAQSGKTQTDEDFEEASQLAASSSDEAQGTYTPVQPEYSPVQRRKFNRHSDRNKDNSEVDYENLKRELDHFNM